MTMDEYVATIVKQLQTAKDNQEIEEVIRVSISDMTERKKNGFIIQRCLRKLRTAIEEISPLTCSSDQWACYRFALVCIGNAAGKH